MTKEEALHSLRDMAIINGHNLKSAGSVVECKNCYMKVYKPSIVVIGEIRIGSASLRVCSNARGPAEAESLALGGTLNKIIGRRVFRDK